MSVESAKAFFAQLKSDEELIDQYNILLSRIADNNSDETQAMNAVVQFAESKGYDFSVDDMKVLLEELKDGQISDAQLNYVTAGRSLTFLVTVNSDGIFYCVHTGI